MQSVIYIIICSVAVLPTNAVQHIYMNLTEGTLNVLCEEAVLDLDDQSPLNIKNLHTVRISKCKPMPFYRLIPSTITKIDLELNAMTSDPPLTEAHFVNLTVRTLTITGQQRLEPSPNFLNPLTTMRKLYVSNMVLPPLPMTSRLDEIWLSNGSSGAIGGCSELEYLTMRQWTVEEIPGGWLASCKQLLHIFMERVDEETIYSVVRGATSIESLWIRNSTLVTLSADLLKGATRLSYLDIIGSGLRSINESAFKDQMTSLMYVKLSNNELRGETSARAILSLSGLQVLFLSNNPLSDFCEHFNTFDRACRPTFLDLAEASIPRLCFTSWSSLTTVYLQRNNITELTLTELPMLKDKSFFIVNLLNNPLRAPPDNRALYDALTEKFKEMEIGRQYVTVKTNQALDCDCQHWWLAKALSKLPSLEIDGMDCGDNLHEDEPAELLECDKFTCEPCDCRRDWRKITTEADCRNRSLHRVPRIESASALLASDNEIAAISAEDFPVSLQLVDLSHNKLRRADAAAAHALVAGGARRVRLAGNPLDCDCENGPLIAALQNNHLTQPISTDELLVSNATRRTSKKLKVEDYSQLKCESSGIPLSRVSVFELCGSAREWVLVAMAAAGVMATLLATFTALYFRHNRVVRVFLHARGLLCCGDDDEADTNFRYDAFVSFAHEDADFAEQLVAGLEGESNGWRTCVHYRDWVPGELIPTQISLSVEQSRRTIVLLSRNFLASKWGMLEFRTAHATALHDGRLRLVLVVLDDVLDARLGAEVRGYVRTNTYVRWDDPWFWDKLLYVMPPRRAPAPQTPSSANCRGQPEFIPLGEIGPSPAVEHS